MMYLLFLRCFLLVFMMLFLLIRCSNSFYCRVFSASMHRKFIATRDKCGICCCCCYGCHFILNLWITWHITRSNFSLNQVRSSQRQQYPFGLVTLPSVCLLTLSLKWCSFFCKRPAQCTKHMTSNSSISIKVNDTHFAQRRIKMELTVNGLVQKTVHVFVVYDRYKWACFVVYHLLEPDQFYLGIFKACCNN